MAAASVRINRILKLQVVPLRTGTYGTNRHRLSAVFPSHPRPPHLPCPLPTCFQPVPRPSASTFGLHLRPPPSPHSHPERTAAAKTSNSQGSFLFFIGVKTPPPHTDRNKSCPFPEEEIPPACAASRRYRPWDCVSWTSTLFSKRLAPPCFGDLLPWSSQLE